MIWTAKDMLPQHFAQTLPIVKFFIYILPILPQSYFSIYDHLDLLQNHIPCSDNTCKLV